MQPSFLNCKRQRQRTGIRPSKIWLSRLWPRNPAANHQHCRRRQRAQPGKEANEKAETTSLHIPSSVNSSITQLLRRTYPCQYLIPAILPRELCRAERVTTTRRACFEPGSIPQQTDPDPPGEHSASYRLRLGISDRPSAYGLATR